MRTKLLVRAIIAVIVFFICVIYVNYYTSYKLDYNITQSYLDSIDISVLHERYPIIIYDQICKPSKLLTTLFAYSYVFSKQETISTGLPIYNPSKYLILWSDNSNVVLNIINPKYKKNIQWSKKNTYSIATIPLENLDKNIQYITVKLKQHQVIILPAFWIFDLDKNTNTKINGIFLDDTLSFFMRYF
jgi:hypothetical protein